MDKTEEVPAGWEAAHDTATVTERAFLVALARLLVGDPGQPLAMTMHQAKGTEFSRVLLFD